MDAPAASHALCAHLRFRQPSAEHAFPCPSRPRICASQGRSVRASSNSICGGLTTRSPARVSGCWPCAPTGPGANVEFEPQDIWRAERGDCVEETGVGSGLADRPPERCRFRSAISRSARSRARTMRSDFVRVLERRVDQDQAAPLLGRQIGVERDIAVRADDAEPPVAPERGDQSLAFFRMRFAKRDAVLRAHERLRDGRRPGIGGGPALGSSGPTARDRAQELGDRRRRARLQERARCPRAIPASASPRRSPRS